MKITIVVTVILGVGSTVSARPPNPLDVCRAVKLSAAKDVEVRGTGEFGREGLVIGDLTCPIAKSPELSIPALVVIDVAVHDSSSIESRYKRWESRDPSPLVQVLARGDLRCRLDFRARRNETGEIVGGNGFGSQGLIKCRLSSARLILLEELRGPGSGFELK